MGGHVTREHICTWITVGEAHPNLRVGGQTGKREGQPKSILSSKLALGKAAMSWLPTAIGGVQKDQKRLQQPGTDNSRTTGSARQIWRQESLYWLGGPAVRCDTVEEPTTGRCVVYTRETTAFGQLAMFGLLLPAGTLTSATHGPAHVDYSAGEKAAVPRGRPVMLRGGKRMRGMIGSGTRG